MHLYFFISSLLHERLIHSLECLCGGSIECIRINKSHENIEKYRTYSIEYQLKIKVKFYQEIRKHYLAYPNHCGYTRCNEIRKSTIIQAHPLSQTPTHILAHPDTHSLKHAGIHKTLDWNVMYIQITIQFKLINMTT